MLILIFNEFLLLFLFISENAPESQGGAQEKIPFFSAAIQLIDDACHNHKYCIVLG